MTVPDNDIARLMYYLNCVCTTINCNREQDIQRFTSYNNWFYLSIEEQKALVVLCYKFNSDEFNNQVFSHSDVLCGDILNQFCEIDQVSRQVLAAESIVIAGQRCEDNEIMTYTMQWMRTYYVDPMRRLVARLNVPSQYPALTYTITSKPIYTLLAVRQRFRGTDSRKCTTGLVCCALWCFLCIIPAITGLIYGIIQVIMKE